MKRWLLILVACGGIDPEQSEAKVKEIAEASTHAKVSKVDCPKVAREKGVKFECTVDFVEGGEQTMLVTVLLEEGRDIDPKWAAPSVVSKHYLGEQLSKREQDQYDCGEGVVAAPVDIECKGIEKTLLVTMDENGDAHW